MSKQYLIITFFLLISITLCGCQLEHARFDFVIEEFENLQTDEYSASEKLDKYKIKDVIIRPWIREVQHGVYRLNIYGYTNNHEENSEIQIKSVLLYTESGMELINLPEYNTIIAYSKTEKNDCYRADDIGSFTADVETVQKYNTLYLEVEVDLIVDEQVETADLLYKINIMEYLTTYMIT